MKLAVVTVAIGDHYSKLSVVTHPTIKRYSEKVGADFISITKQKVSRSTPHWEKFQIYDLLKTYDRILYVDTDIIIRKCAPNIFDIIPEDCLGIFNEATFVLHREYAMTRAYEAYGITNIGWDGRYYNSGVMVISRCHRDLFIKPKREVANFYEQSFLNIQIQKHATKIFDLPYQFNRMFCLDQFLGRERYECYFIHYAGLGTPEVCLKVITEEAVRIEALPDDYVSPQYIWINVQGGLGDQVQAEPVLRFALNHVWKGCDMRVHTHFPELFSHLPIKCARHEVNLWPMATTQPFSRTALPGHETLHSQVVSHMMCHTVDFSSMAILKRILPDVDKSYHLEVDPICVKEVIQMIGEENISKCVLLHAGRHWESKTIPEYWWELVIDEIISLGLIPVLIGKDGEENGVLKLKERKEIIDLTNRLTLKQLIATISIAPILISNDSSPIHIAGAFDNWIILIPTCKHPDHLLPWRKGSKSYKSFAPYKRLVLDDLNTSTAQIGAVLGNSLPGKWEDYLPDPSSIREKIKNVYTVDLEQTEVNNGRPKHSNAS